MHAAADGPQAVEDGETVGVGEEVGEGDAAAVGLDLQAPAAGGGELDGVPAEAGVGTFRVDGRDLQAGDEGQTSVGDGSQILRQVPQVPDGLVALRRAEEADLAFRDSPVRHDVELPLRAEEGVGRGQRVHEARVPGHQAADVHRRAAIPLREALGLVGKAGGGDEGRAPVPVVEPGVRGRALDVQAPLHHPTAAGHDRLGVARGLSRLQDPEGPGRLAPAADRGPRQLATDLLVRHRHQQEVGRRRLSAVAEEVQRSQQGGEAALHVEGAGGHQAVPVEAGRSRGKDGIQVAHEEEGPPRRAVPRIPPGLEDGQGPARLRRGLVVDLGGESARAQLSGEPLRHPAQARGVAAGRGDLGQLPQEADRALENGLGQGAGEVVHVRQSLPQAGS